MVRYCDGASFSGNVDDEMQVSRTVCWLLLSSYVMQFNCIEDTPSNPLWSMQDDNSFFFRGQRIWEAVMSELLSKGLSRAKEVTFLQKYAWL